MTSRSSTRTDSWRLKQLPTSIAIIGGGVIGTEYASILATMGVRVTLIERRPRLLEFVDTEIIEALQYQMRNIGITLRFNEEVVSIDKAQDGRIIVRLKSGKEIGTNSVLYSVGRMGATAELQSPCHRHHSGQPRTAAGQWVFPDIHPPYLCRRGHHRVSGAGLHIDAARSPSGLSRLRPPLQPSTDNLMPYGIYAIPEISMVGPKRR